MLVLRHLTMRYWSQRRTAAPLKPIPTETAVKRVSVLDRPRRREAALRAIDSRRSRYRESVFSLPVLSRLYLAARKDTTPSEARMPKASNVPMSTLIRGELFAPIEKTTRTAPTA